MYLWLLTPYCISCCGYSWLFSFSSLISPFLTAPLSGLPVAVSFLTSVPNYPTGSNLKKKGFVLAHSSMPCSSPSRRRKRGGRRQLVTYIHSQEAEKKQEVSPASKALGLASSELLSPTRLYIINVPQSPQILPPAGDQLFEHMSL